MNERLIIVTGASRGIGAGIVSELVRRGFNVVGLSRSGEVPAGRGLVCDMRDEQAIATVFAQLAKRGTIFGLVNNAGVHQAVSSAGLMTTDFERLMALNATAVMIASREAYPYLKESGGGIIVNIGSFFDKLGVAGNLAYCASKAAVGAMTRCLAVEWAGDNISVINVAPGYIETDLNREVLSSASSRKWLARRVPAGRPGQVQEVAALVGSLFADNIAFLTGETIYIDGGQGMNH